MSVIFIFLLRSWLHLWLQELGHTAVVGVGPLEIAEDRLEDIDVGKENVRTAAAGEQVVEEWWWGWG